MNDVGGDAAWWRAGPPGSTAGPIRGPLQATRESHADGARVAARRDRSYARRAMSAADESRHPPAVRDTRRDASAGEMALWARAKTVFLDAIERPESERGAFVLAACAGDPRLKAEVDALLASEQAAANLWETPAIRLLGEDAASETGLLRPRLQRGTRLGSYEILDFIAAGGMGEVYHARH